LVGLVLSPWACFVIFLVCFLRGLSRKNRVHSP
jgi:hypothetical protein